MLGLHVVYRSVDSNWRCLCDLGVRFNFHQFRDVGVLVYRRGFRCKSCFVYEECRVSIPATCASIFQLTFPLVKREFDVLRNITGLPGNNCSTIYLKHHQNSIIGFAVLHEYRTFLAMCKSNQLVARRTNKQM